MKIIANIGAASASYDSADDALGASDPATADSPSADPTFDWTRLAGAGFEPSGAFAEADRIAAAPMTVAAGRAGASPEAPLSPAASPTDAASASTNPFAIHATIQAGAPAGFATAVDDAIQYFEKTFTADVTMNINFDWAPESGDDVATTVTDDNLYKYATVAAHLKAADGKIIADNGLVLPKTDPFSASGDYQLETPANQLWLSPAEAAALGLKSSDSSSSNKATDATITLNSDDSFSFDPGKVGASEYDAVSDLEHEISEAMGRSLGGNNAAGDDLLPAPLALFRFDSSGAIDTSDNVADDYFSIDGGKTSLRAGMGEPNGDLADWGDTTDDAVGYEQTGAVQVFTPVDVSVMEALGWFAGDVWEKNGADTWSNAKDWSLGAPTSAQNVLVAQGAPQVDAPLKAQSLAISASASVVFSSAGFSVVGGAVDNRGVLAMDSASGAGGSALAIEGALDNAATLFIAPSGGVLSAVTTLFAGSLANTGLLELDPHSGAEARLIVDGPVSNSNLVVVAQDSMADFAGPVGGGGEVAVDTGGLLYLGGAGNKAVDDTAAHIVGGGAVVIQSPGVVQLGAGDGYAGGTTVNSGATLSISAAADIGTGGLSLQDDATLSLTASLAIGADVSLSGVANLEVTKFWDVFDGGISGTGSLVVSGGGGLVLQGDDSFTGGVTMTGGVLDIDAIGGLGTGELILDDGAGLDLVGTMTLGNAIKIDGVSDVYVPTGDAATIDGAIADGGAEGGMAVVGGGELVLAGANTLTGGVTVENGALAISAADNLGYGPLTLEAGTTLDLTAAMTIAAHLTLSGVANLNVAKFWDVFDGGVSGAGSLVVSGGGGLVLQGVDSFGGGVTMRGGVLDVDAVGGLGSGALILDDDAGLDLVGTMTIGNAIEIEGVSDVYVPTGATAAIGGLVSDGAAAGGLDLVGGGVLVLTDANTYSGGTTVQSGATLSISGSGDVGPGAMTLDAGATLTVARGATAALAAGASLAGSVAGAGTLALNGGSTTIASGAALAVSNWRIFGPSTSVIVGESLAYGGHYTQGADATLELTGGSLVLAGSASFDGAATLTGAGSLVTFGSTAISGLTIGGTATWSNDGEVGQGGDVTIGDATGAAAALVNRASGTYDITDDSSIESGASPASSIENLGQLAKTGGTGVSAIVPDIVNSGTIAVSSGTLDLRGSVSGAGQLQIDGAANLEVDGAVASGQTLLFSGSGGEFSLHDLMLGGPELFQGSIGGFDVGDAIDAGAFGTGTSFVYSENSGDAAGVLTLTNGANHASIDFLGNYSTANFLAAADGHGGTLLAFHP